MIVQINIIRVIIPTITITTITIAISHREESIIFVAKKIVTITSIQMMNNRRQKNFGDKIKNFTEIKVNIIYIWLIVKQIQMMILLMIVKK